MPHEQNENGSAPCQFVSKLAITLVALLIFAWIQFSSPFLASQDDPYYHVAVSRLYAREGIVKAFPWTQFSIQKDGFGDRHFLFHIGMIPFLWKDEIRGAKTYCVILATACVLVLALLLHSFRVPHVWLWVLLLFSSGSFFLYRFSVCRPQICAVLFALLSFWAVCKQRIVLTFLASLFAFLFYSSAHLAIIFAAIHAGVVFLRERRLLWKPMAAASAGFAVALLVHPHFPAIVKVWFIQNFHVIYHSLAGTPGLNLGAELGPPTADSLVKACAVLLLTCLGLVFYSMFSGKSLSVVALTAFVCMCGFFLLTFLSKRFIEYSAPFMCLFGGLAFQSLRSPKHQPQNSFFRVLVLLLALPALGLGAKAVLNTREAIANVGAPKLKPAALWLLSNSKQGEVVFTCDWDDFPQLFFFNAKNYYLVGLDPTFFLAHDAKLFELWNRIRMGAQRNISQEIARYFKAKFFLATNEFQEAIKNARADTGLEEVYSDQVCSIFALRAAVREARK